jgi:predicted RecA/RadA family phage recombinase
MKNYIQPGGSLTVAAPYDRLSGQGCLVGALFGVCVTDALNGANVSINTIGVYELAKAGAQAWTVGAKVYWDNAAKACTTVAAGNTLIGCAAAAVGNGDGETLGQVRLNGVVA